MSELLLYFLVGMLVCFLGTIPFGPINLSVVKITVDHNATRGLEVALAASLIEIVEALIAMTFGMAINDFLTANTVVKTVIALAFVLAALFLLRRKPAAELHTDSDGQRSFFLRGLLLAALNPQAIPFWIFALATITQYMEFEYQGSLLVAFLVGVFVGKAAALSGFVYASTYLKSHLQQSSQWVNRILAGILLIIGMSQLWGLVVAS